MVDCYLFIAAGGAGHRFSSGIPKQYARIGQQTLLEHSIDRFAGLAGLAGVFVGIAEADRAGRALAESLPVVTATTPAGAERRDTVLRGLEAIARQAPAAAWVLVHDACRPCVRTADIRRLVDSAAHHPAGAILAVPVVDTLKASSDGETVASTVSRKDLWQAQTPQFFPLHLLIDCLGQCAADGLEATDEAMAVEHCGHKVGLVAGEHTNIKVTRAPDLELAKAIMAMAEGAG